MISEEKLDSINKKKRRKTISRLIEPIVFLSFFFISNLLGFSYSMDNNLFNDKLIDVCAIFFGIFIGCLFLFEKFKNAKTYEEFLEFCRKLLYLNIFIIAFSFIIILVNPLLPDLLQLNLSINIKPKVLVFSVYVSLFSIVILRIFRFVKIILIILKSN